MGKKKTCLKRGLALLLSLAMVLTGQISVHVPTAEAAETPKQTEDSVSGENVALKAKADAKYTNNGLSPDSINDDVLAEGANTSWNSWGTDDYPMWVSLTWDVEYDLTGMEVLWWSDNWGVPFPKECYVEYLEDDGETWTKISDVGVETTPGGYNGENEVWNKVAFPETIRTTSLRLQIERNGGDRSGVGISEWKAYGKEAVVDEPTNVALKAKAGAKYTNNGLSPDSINDDVLAEDANTSWNSWGTDDYPMWVSLTWDVEYDLTGMEVLWWSDNWGVPFPKECYVEYLEDDGETWTKISDVGVETTPGGYNGANKVWNKVAFPETIRTTSLRLQIERSGSDSSGVGISEWKAYGKEAVVDEPTNVALKAKAAAKYTNDGLSPDKINDDALAGGDPSTSWNSWGPGEYPMWVSLTWDVEYDLTGMEVLWWSDDGGVPFPKECYVEYLEDDGETWTKISDVGVETTPGGYNGANKVWNKVAFPETIRTTSLRLQIERNGDGWDGVGISEWRAYGEEAEDELTNVALKAKADAKHTNSFGGVSVDKINDGTLAGSDTSTCWNSWGTEDDPMWVTLTWDGVYDLTDMEVLWWTYYDGGVIFPQSSYVEYLDMETGEWKKISDVGVEHDSPGYDGANNVWNQVTFPETVTTTSLRLQIVRGESGNKGVGISEWRVTGRENKKIFYGAQITGAAKMAVGASEEYVGSALPETMSDKASYEWSVAEDSTDIIQIQEDQAQQDSVTVTALKAGIGTLKLKVTVAGLTKETEYQIKVEGVESIDPYITTTAAGKAPILPDSVVANGLTFDDPTPSLMSTNNNVQLGESFDSRLIPVTWETVSAASYAEDQIGNTFTVQGIASYGGATYEATAQVTVKAPAQVAESNRIVTFENVQLNDGFWTPKQETNAITSLNKAISEIEKASGGEPNFDNAIRKLNGEEYGAFSGYVFQDSDIYKSIEAISYTLSATQNETGEEIVAQRQKLQDKLDVWIEKIEKVQYADGYIDTHFTLRSTTYDGGGAPGTHRWREFSNHEMYNAGHFLEGVVAYTRYREGIGDPDYRLYVAGKRFADEIVSLFGPDGTRHEVPGHEEIELGLVKFAKLAEEYEGEGATQKYYDTVKTLIDRRGENYQLRDSGYRGGTYSQDATNFKEETNAVGHSVRAGYFYTGVTDIAATLEEGNEDRKAYLNSLSTIWNSVTNRRSYITGGVGTTAPGADSEGFGADYLLPNDQSYCEICAAISMANWNQRMNLVYEDAKYADIVEKDLYNAILVGTNLDGNRFYYSTLLEVDGGNARSEWFGCACCPPNLMRTIASLSGYMYTVHNSNVFVNMFMGSNGTVNVEGTPVELTQETKYPWNGAVKLTVNPEESKEFTMKIRIPGWVEEQNNKNVTIKVNNEAVSTDKVKGYVSITRTWKQGDVIDIDIPMEIRKTEADPNVEANQGRIALQRGPIVYCMEKAGNAQLNPEIADFDPLNFIIPKEAELTATYNENLLDGVIEITGDVLYLSGKEAIPAKLQAVPYYSWNNRGDDADYVKGQIKNNSSKMLIWTWYDIPEIEEPFVDLSDVSLTASSVKSDYTSSWENLEGIKTNWEPESSYGDGKHTWGNWNQEVGSEHYVQYTWDSDITTDRMQVYWYDDLGGTRVPGTLIVKYLKEDGDPNLEEDWLTANMITDWADAQARDQYNTIEIDKITTKGIRLVMTVRQGGASAATGICRWKVFDEQAPVRIVIEMINAIGTVEATAECKERIEAARRVYNSLSEAQKAEVVNIDQLTAAEEEYEELAKPTESPKPTDTPKPEDTPKPTDTPSPTDTPKPTDTPSPTDTPKPEDTPSPTDTPKPEDTPNPTDTPKATDTPKPADTPNPPTVTKAPDNTAPYVSPQSTVENTVKITVKQKKSNSVAVKWSAIRGADSYRVYYGLRGNKFKKYKKLGGSKRTVTLKKLKKGRYYKIRICAYKKINGKDKRISSAPNVYIVTKGGKYKKPVSVKLITKLMSVAIQ